MNDLYELLNNAELNLDEYDNRKLSDYETRSIKRQVSKEVRKMKKGKKYKSIVAAACASILLGAGSVSVLAATGVLPDAFYNMFGLDTDKKIEAANRMGTSVGDNDEENGYRVTAEGVLRDEDHVSIVYRIEKADGSSLGKDGEVCTAVDFDSFENDADWQAGMCNSVDSNKSDKYIEYFTSFTFKEGVDDSLNMTLKDMTLYFGERQVPVEGTWKLSIPLNQDESTVEYATGQHLIAGKNEGTLEKCKISPIGFSIKIKLFDPVENNELLKDTDGNLVLYLKNGEKVSLGGSSFPSVNDDGTWDFSIVGFFDKMILPEDIDKIVIGETEIEI